MKTQATTKDAYQLMHDGIQALARAERQGIRIDVEYCNRMKAYLTRKINYYQKKLENTNFYRRWLHIYRNRINIYSDDQLSNVLYKHMELVPDKKTESGKGSTDEETLKRLGIPELQYIIRLRKLSKIRDTYLEQFIRETNDDGYMRPSFNLHTVRTYRSSSSNPNFQNIPKRDKEAMEICRRAILPRPGHMLVEADFAALEVAIGAAYHKDPVMLAYLRNPDSDMHLDMARQIFKCPDLPKQSILRKAAKNAFVFPQFYGDYYGNNAKGLCEWTELPLGKWKDTDGIDIVEGVPLGKHMRAQGIKSYDQFVEHMKWVEDDFWNNRFKVYNAWKQKWISLYRKRGYLQMYTGFICSGVMRKNEIVNYPIQGTAFHCLLSTLIHLDRIMQERDWDSKIVGQIHDSIVMDAVPEELDEIEQTLNHIVKEVLPEQWPWIIVPLEIETTVYPIDGPWIET